MKIVETKIDGVFIIEPKVYLDNRGFFSKVLITSSFVKVLVKT